MNNGDSIFIQNNLNENYSILKRKESMIHSQKNDLQFSNELGGKRSNGRVVVDVCKESVKKIFDSKIQNKGFTEETMINEQKIKNDNIEKSKIKGDLTHFVTTTTNYTDYLFNIIQNVIIENHNRDDFSKNLANGIEYINEELDKRESEIVSLYENQSQQQNIINDSCQKIIFLEKTTENTRNDNDFWKNNFEKELNTKAIAEKVDVALNNIEVNVKELFIKFNDTNEKLIKNNDYLTKNIKYLEMKMETYESELKFFKDARREESKDYISETKDIIQRKYEILSKRIDETEGKWKEDGLVFKEEMWNEKRKLLTEIKNVDHKLDELNRSSNEKLIDLKDEFNRVSRGTNQLINELDSKQRVAYKECCDSRRKEAERMEVKLAKAEANCKEETESLKQDNEALFSKTKTLEDKIFNLKNALEDAKRKAEADSEVFALKRELFALERSLKSDILNLKDTCIAPNSEKLELVKKELDFLGIKCETISAATQTLINKLDNEMMNTKTCFDNQENLLNQEFEEMKDYVSNRLEQVVNNCRNERNVSENDNKVMISDVKEKIDQLKTEIDELKELGRQLMNKDVKEDWKTASIDDSMSVEKNIEEDFATLMKNSKNDFKMKKDKEKKDNEDLNSSSSADKDSSSESDSELGKRSDYDSNSLSSSSSDSDDSSDSSYSNQKKKKRKNKKKKKLRVKSQYFWFIDMDNELRVTSRKPGIKLSLLKTKKIRKLACARHNFGKCQLEKCPFKHIKGSKGVELLKVFVTKKPYLEKFKEVKEKYKPIRCIRTIITPIEKKEISSEAKKLLSKTLIFKSKKKEKKKQNYNKNGKNKKFWNRNKFYKPRTYRNRRYPNNNYSQLENPYNNNYRPFRRNFDWNRRPKNFYEGPRKQFGRPRKFFNDGYRFANPRFNQNYNFNNENWYRQPFKKPFNNFRRPRPRINNYQNNNGFFNDPYNNYYPPRRETYFNGFNRYNNNFNRQDF